jgi:hypothetical protein
MTLDLKFWLLAVWNFSLFLDLAVAAKLSWTGLWRKYRWFCILLVYGAARTLIAMNMNPKTKSYGLFWLCTEVGTWIIYTGCLRELFALVLGRYPGIRSFGRTVLWVMLGAATLVAAMSMYPDWAVNHGSANPVQVVLLLSRAFTSIVFFHLILMMAFLVWFPVVLPRNAILHCLLFTLYFLSKSFAILLRNIGGWQAQPESNLVLQVAGCLSLMVWLLRMSPAGESVTIVVGHLWNRDEEERLTNQLQNINSMLTRLEVKTIEDAEVGQGRG